MERSRSIGRAPRRASSSPRRSPADRPAHGLLVLQQQAGTRAVVAALQRGAGPGPSVLVLPRESGSLAPAQPVQRVPGQALGVVEDVAAEGAGVEAPAQDGAGQLNALVAQQVAALPNVDEAVLPEPQQAEAPAPAPAATRTRARYPA